MNLVMKAGSVQWVEADNRRLCLCSDIAAKVYFYFISAIDYIRYSSLFTSI